MPSRFAPLSAEPLDARRHVIPIHENYKEYQAPLWVRPTVERLLASLQSQHIGGLRSVVLSDSAAVGRGRTGRVKGRKYNRHDCRGFYHEAWRGEAPWIELVIDNILASQAASLLRWQLFRDLAIGRTLYHEVGHHLHATVGSAAEGGEASAENWRKRLSKLHGRKRYWYLRPLRLFLLAFLWLLRRARALMTGRSV